MATKTPASRELGALERAYEPAKVEGRWYRYWLDNGYFQPAGDPDQEPFVIIMPPPNVTGELHMGHALFVTVEDIMTRYQRMRGRPTLWLPGADHAGIAGQWVVEKEIAKQGLTRHELGRERFLENVWEWMDKYQIRIREQLASLGASCDWEYYVFTMDPGPVRAVRRVFKQLYDEGLIYRGVRMISWCPRCNTALSDLEVIHRELHGHLWHLRYQVEGEQRFIEVATTRPETMLADTAVAVHPDDERYRNLIGKYVILPILGRRLPVIADEAVDPAFGSGALKVTPAHDFNDYEMGNRHELPRINILHSNGVLNENAGPFDGQTIAEARRSVVARLEADGALVRVEPHTHSVGTCERCETVVEPLISKQWFVSMKPLAAPAIEVVKDGTVRFVPDRYTGVYLNWMENIQDWTISRQLWWGHRIPVWYCSDCAHEWASEAEVETVCPACGAGGVYQDPDVLDTWFSSGLWPFSTLGWPDETPQLARFYPSTVMETGAEIIFFWVARMIFFGLKFMGEAPFSTVYIHGTVRDAEGQRMSKTKGNVLEPTQIADKYGTDALRFTLITVSGPGTDLKLAEERVEASRNFANKLYNASRFVLSAIDGAEIARGDDDAPLPPDAHAQAAPDGWIVTKLHETIEETTRLIDEYQFHEAGRTLYEFLWSEFCDWYIEAAKVRLREDAVDPVVPQTLAYVLERSLRLLHPFMPFVTEELWQRLPHGGDALIIAEWPSAGATFPEHAEQFEAIKEATRLIRNARAEQGVEPARRIAAIVYPGSEAEIYRALAGELQFLARIDGEGYEVRQGEPEPQQNSIAIVSGAATLYLPIAGMVDLDAERARLNREIEESEAEVARASAMLSNEQFVGRAPEQVVQAQRGRLAQADERTRALRARLSELG